jgi:hypothetical protein
MAEDWKPGSNVLRISWDAIGTSIPAEMLNKQYLWAFSTFWVTFWVSIVPFRAPAGSSQLSRPALVALWAWGASFTRATLAAIAQELEARGVRTPAGRDRWAPAQVSRLRAPLSTNSERALARLQLDRRA